MVAQKLSTTGFPRSSDRDISDPSSVSSVKSGALAPTWGIELDELGELQLGLATIATEIVMIRTIPVAHFLHFMLLKL